MTLRLRWLPNLLSQEVFKPVKYKCDYRNECPIQTLFFATSGRYMGEDSKEAMHCQEVVSPHTMVLTIFHIFFFSLNILATTKHSHMCSAGIRWLPKLATVPT